MKFEIDNIIFYKYNVIKARILMYTFAAIT